MRAPTMLSDALWVLAIALVLTTAHHLDPQIEDASAEWAQAEELLAAQRAAQQAERRERAEAALCAQAVGPNSAPRHDETGALHCTTRRGLVRQVGMDGDRP